MNKAFLNSHNAGFKGFIKSLQELSAPQEHEQNTTGRRPVLEQCCKAKNLDGIDFDAIRNEWFPAKPNTNVPCSTDALVFQNNGTYLIEFKSGDAEKANLLRKIYDSVMMLIEKDSQTFQTMRSSAVYIVVNTDLENSTKAVMRSIFYRKKPWEHATYTKSTDRWNLKNLEGVIVKSVYCMSPEIFNIFVNIERWS